MSQIEWCVSIRNERSKKRKRMARLKIRPKRLIHKVKSWQKERIVGRILLKLDL